MENTELIKTKDALKILNRSRAQLYLLRIANRLPSTKIEGRYYYKQEDVVRLCNELNDKRSWKFKKKLNNLKL